MENTWIESAPNAFLLDSNGLTSERIADRVRALLGPESRGTGSDKRI